MKNLKFRAWDFHGQQNTKWAWMLPLNHQAQEPIAPVSEIRCMHGRNQTEHTDETQQ